jgi:ferredoxin
VRALQRRCTFGLAAAGDQVSDRFLNVDPTRCVGHGLCAEILPEAISLDDWGFPIIGSEPLPRWLHRQGARARTACPALALSLDRQPRRKGGPSPGSRARSTSPGGSR